MPKLEMTYQEMFDYSVGGLIKQGERAVDENGNCQYRTEDNKKCALGMLIPDVLYDPKMEEWGIHAFELNNFHQDAYNFSSLLSKTQRNFASKLQVIHDNLSCSWQEMLDRYKNLAKEHNLKLTVFEKD